MWAAVLIALAGAIAVSAGTFFLIVAPLARQQGSTHVSQREARHERASHRQLESVKIG